uniref:Uncharacterized protein n=1 Tax=Anguilla anguilla TaxID=7936 RepID=A0A0E9U671_ANGAN
MHSTYHKLKGKQASTLLLSD